jgi:transcriptional regulator with XRE-family HTH domain
MSARVKQGTYRRSCRRCGWTGTYNFPGRADYAKRKHSCERWIEKARAAEHGRALRAAVDRTLKPCLHKQANHQHGTYACYVLDACRCPNCANAHKEYETNRVRQHAYGRWSNLVDAEPSRRHILHLTDQGMGLKRIVAVSGISQGVLWKLVYGKRRPDDTRVPTRRVRQGTEQRILAIKVDLAQGAKVDSCGTRRRLQALVAIGYSQSRLAQRLGMSPTNFTRTMHHNSEVLKQTADAAVSLYNELSMTPAVGTDQRSRISVTRARRYAEHMMWLPPLAWDDESIDDPFSQPAEMGEPDRRDLLDDFDWLVDSGESEHHAAAQLGVTLPSIERARARREAA